VGEIRLKSADPLALPSIQPNYFSDPEGVWKLFPFLFFFLRGFEVEFDPLPQYDLKLMVEAIKISRKIAQQPCKNILFFYVFSCQFR